MYFTFALYSTLERFLLDKALYKFLTNIIIISKHFHNVRHSKYLDLSAEKSRVIWLVKPLHCGEASSKPPARSVRCGIRTETMGVPAHGFTRYATRAHVVQVIARMSMRPTGFLETPSYLDGKHCLKCKPFRSVILPHRIAAEVFL